MAGTDAFPITWKTAFQRSRWFERGWTVQELLAPSYVEFFSKEGKRLGSRISLEREIYEITEIPVEVLRGQSLVERSVEERMSWVAKRTTTIKEDKAYCLLGIFGVFLSPIYGEGEAHAMLRLREEIQKRQEGLRASEALFTVPFSRDSLFVGREDILTKIDQSTTAAQTHTRTALVGLGGVGKSQIAIEHAYRCRMAKPHTSAFWIHASSSTRFRQGYRDIADRLALPGREDTDMDMLQLVHNWLSDRQNKPWLMILDNVDDDSVFFGDNLDTADDSRPLESFIPQAAHGTILITSRNEVAATNLVGGHGDVVAIEPMSEDEALALLHTRVPFTESGRADAKELVHALERIPLAIMHAAAYIKTRASTTTLSSYLGLFRESEANQLHLLSKREWKDIRRDHSTRDAVIATWHISFKHIQMTEPRATDLLALMSMFDKQGVPRWLLQGTSSQLDFEDSLAPLLSFSLVRIERGKQALEMHRLVQLSIRRWLEGAQELWKWMNQSIEAVNAVFPDGKYGTWETCKALLPHLQVVVSHKPKDTDFLAKQASIASRGSWYLMLNGDYKAAEAYMRLSLSIRETALGPEHEDTLNSLCGLGLILKNQGNYKDAEAMHRQTLKGREKALGREHSTTVKSVSYLGSVLELQGHYKEAEAMYRRALKGVEKERVLGQEHLDTLASACCLGTVLMRQAKYEEAESISRRVLVGYQKTLGKSTPMYF